MRRASLVAVLAAAGAGSAHAQMIGAPLRAEWLNPEFETVIESHLVEVGAWVELRPEDILNDDKFSINIRATTIDFDFTSDAIWTKDPFNGWRFEDVNDVLPPVIGYHLFSYQQTVFPVVETGWSENAFWANFAGTEFQGAGRLTMQVIFLPTPGAAAVAGCAGLMLLRRRRAR